MTPLIPWPWAIIIGALALAVGFAHLKGWLEFHHMETGAVLAALGWRLWSVGDHVPGAIIFLVGFAIFTDDALQEFVKVVIRKDHRSSANVIFTWLWSDVLDWSWPFKF
jgi:hypothetical protein